ncbi:hypothetical protein ITJ86_06600 [Winogradskyella sp. F6397]|uniref:O-antigen ligase domain-containing protein n=1 Tax=Winogradskyella marina TaxID=2785530 RepID=A0ABS0EGI5_9FLAO|nr:hypothetical protein [Winogradskyella marina]MBF8149560.1 hypothetical protein [Winogradskyella marina]
MNKLIVFTCFYWPFFFSCLQLQGYITYAISQSLAVNLAYINLGLIITGTVLFRNKINTTSKTSRLWIIYFIIYYCFGFLALGRNGFQSSILPTFIPVIYFIGFYFLLSNKEQFKTFFKVITITFVISSFFTVLLFKLNFNLAANTTHGWALDRADGLYGDANNAALASIIAYTLFDKFYNPSKFLFKAFKILVLLIIFYSLFVTFSTTGLFVFTIILFITNYKFFNGLKLILLGTILVLFYIGIFAFKSQTKELDLSDAQISKIDNIINVLTLNLDKVNNSGRDHLLENILYYLYENPIIGNGVDFSVAHTGHNTYVGVWVDAGILTFLFFMFILFYYFFKTLTLKIHLRFFAMSLLIVLYVFMMSLQTVINQPYLIVLFVFVGYLIDYSKMDEGHLDFFN